MTEELLRDEIVRRIHALLEDWRETADIAELNDGNAVGVKVLRVCIDKLSHVLMPPVVDDFVPPDGFVAQAEQQS